MVYVDALFLTHSDQDHCRGMREYFNLCSPEKMDDTKIRINELFVPARLLIDTEHKELIARVNKLTEMMTRMRYDRKQIGD